MVTHTSNSPAETESLGESAGKSAKPGWVICLSGELGAGKTHWVRGFARGLGVTSRVHSPTYALVNAYEGGRLPLHHLDLFRLAGPEEIISAGLEDYLHPEGVAVIEWAERWFGDQLRAGKDPSQFPPSPRRVRWVAIETINERTRRITYEDSGD